MFAKLKHMAIVSEQYTLLGRFYEGMFGMKPSANARPFGAVVVRDGYVGMNINPRKGKAGRQAGLDHFGFEVEDLQKMAESAVDAGAQQGPRDLPRDGRFAEVFIKDPAGQRVDLSKQGWKT